AHALICEADRAHAVVECIPYVGNVSIAVLLLSSSLIAQLPEAHGIAPHIGVGLSTANPTNPRRWHPIELVHARRFAVGWPIPTARSIARGNNPLAPAEVSICVHDREYLEAKGGGPRKWCSERGCGGLLLDEVIACERRHHISMAVRVRMHPPTRSSCNSLGEGSEGAADARRLSELHGTLGPGALNDRKAVLDSSATRVGAQRTKGKEGATNQCQGKRRHKGHSR